jgi:hypothetical protein
MERGADGNPAPRDLRLIDAFSECVNADETGICSARILGAAEAILA